jgi:hypothetical protein
MKTCADCVYFEHVTGDDEHLPDKWCSHPRWDQRIEAEAKPPCHGWSHWPKDTPRPRHGDHSAASVSYGYSWR